MRLCKNGTLENTSVRIKIKLLILTTIDISYFEKLHLPTGFEPSSSTLKYKRPL